MEISLRHSLSYMTKGDVPVSIVAKSLLANERLIQESMRVLGDCIDGMEVQRVVVRVSHISNTSPLKQVFAIALIAAFQEDLVREVPELFEQLTGSSVPDSYNTLATVLVLMLALCLIDSAVERFLPGRSAKRLKRQYEDKLDELARMTKLDREKIESVLEERLKGGKLRSLVSRARDFFSPAKVEPNVEIRIEEGEGVSSDAISEIPSDEEFEQIERRNVYDLHDVPIEIHRADIDYHDQGWVAVVEEVSDRRRKIYLPPELSPADLYGEKKIRGDVTVVEERSMDGEYAVKEYHLIRQR